MDMNDVLKQSSIIYQEEETIISYSALIVRKKNRPINNVSDGNGLT